MKTRSRIFTLCEAQSWLIAFTLVIGAVACSTQHPVSQDDAPPEREDVALAIGPAGLLDTQWQVVELDSKRLTLAQGERAPELVLASDGNRLQGSTGCNRIAGIFEQTADGFRFKGLLVTRMACAPPGGALEQPFLDALNSTASQRIVSNILEFHDMNGALRMRLEPKPTR